jgi:pimeloyl-ACP methyl ester carboxylesterase
VAPPDNGRNKEAEMHVLALVAAVLVSTSGTASPFHHVTFRTADGKTIHGEVIGTGRIGIVAAHDADSSYSEWEPAARFLSAHGYRIVLFDYRSNPFDSESGSHPRGTFRFDRDVTGAASLLLRLGSKRIVLAGDGIGGLVSLVTAYEDGAPIVGVIALTAGSIKGTTDTLGDPSQPDDLDALAATKRLSAPVLFLAARSDTNVRPLYRAAATTTKQWIPLPESALRANGFGMSVWTATAPWAKSARASILAFLAQQR